MWWDVFFRTGIPPRRLRQLLTLSELREMIAYMGRFPITDEANLQIPQARMFAAYINSRRDTDKHPDEYPMTDFIVGYPSDRVEESEDAGAVLMKNWNRW